MKAPKKNPPEYRRKMQLGLMWIAVGVVLGMLVGLGVEMTKGVSVVVMQLGAMAGGFVGFLVEVILLVWRKWKRRELPKR